MLGRDIWCSLKTPFLLLLAVNIARYERKLYRIWYYLRFLISLSISWEFRSKYLLWNRRTFVLAVLYICFCWIILKLILMRGYIYIYIYIGDWCWVYILGSAWCEVFFCDWGFTIWLSHTIGGGSWSILNGRVSY